MKVEQSVPFRVSVGPTRPTLLQVPGPKSGPTPLTHLWLLLSHQFCNSLGLNFDFLEGKLGVKEFTVNLVRSQET